MSDSLITIVAIFLAAILMFVFPLMSVAERGDDISQLSVQTATNEFVDENNIQIYYNLGFTYKLLGKNKEAIQCFSTVVDENPNDVLAFNHLGVIYTQTGEYEKAVNSFKRGLKIDPNHPILHLNLAKAYEKTGKIDETFLEYDFALRSKPGWLEAIDGYTDLLLKYNSVKTAGDLGCTITASALEMSNVDLANEFSTMIITQRGYQSNSKVITVSDEMLETLIQMKR